MVRSVLLVGLLGFLVACTPQLSRQDRAVLEQVMNERVAGWERAMSNRDQNEIASFYHQVQGVSLAWPNGRRTQGWDDATLAIGDFFRGVARLNFSLQDTNVEILSAGACVATFRFSADVVLSSTDRDIYTGQGTIVWTTDEAGEWRIHTAQLSRSPS
ncbi:MAG TPA: hypothetical protein VGA37_11845 [Gemmatimonadales bacterium]